MKTDKQPSPEPESPSLQEYLEKYLDLLRLANSSPRTVQGYRQEVLSFFRFLEREKTVTDLRNVTPADVDEYQTYLYYYRKPNGKELTTETQITKLTVLRSFFRTLVQARMMAFNPARDVELPRRGERLPHGILSPKETKRLLAAPDTATVYGYRDRTMLEVFYSTGVRPMELAALTVEDVDLANAFLRILQGKGLKDRTLPLGKAACGWLAEYIAKVRPYLVKHGARRRRRKARAEADNIPTGAENLLFLTRGGIAFERSGILMLLKKYARTAGIDKNITARDLRSTMATDMLRGHADIRQIQEMLGHRNLSTTQIYAHVVKDDLKKVHQRTHPRETAEKQQKRGKKTRQKTEGEKNRGKE